MAIIPARCFLPPPPPHLRWMIHQRYSVKKNMFVNGCCDIKLLLAELFSGTSLDTWTEKFAFLKNQLQLIFCQNKTIFLLNKSKRQLDPVFEGRKPTKASLTYSRTSFCPMHFFYLYSQDPIAEALWANRAVLYRQFGAWLTIRHHLQAH